MWRCLQGTATQTQRRFKAVGNGSEVRIYCKLAAFNPASKAWPPPRPPQPKRNLSIPLKSNDCSTATSAMAQIRVSVSCARQPGRVVIETQAGPEGGEGGISLAESHPCSWRLPALSRAEGHKRPHWPTALTVRTYKKRRRRKAV